MLLKRQRTNGEWHFIFWTPTYQFDVALKTESFLAVPGDVQLILHLQVLFLVTGQSKADFSAV
jgi:hypothetical protein